MLYFDFRAYVFMLGTITKFLSFAFIFLAYRFYRLPSNKSSNMSNSLKVDVPNNSANGGEHIVHSMNELEERAQRTEKRTKLGKSRISSKNTIECSDTNAYTVDKILTNMYFVKLNYFYLQFIFFVSKSLFCEIRLINWNKFKGNL